MYNKSRRPEGCDLVHLVVKSQKSFRSPGRSPAEVLQKSSTVEASVTHRQTHTLTFGLLGLLSQPKINLFALEH